MQYVRGGPPRYAHQRRGLQKLISTKGIGALLFDPGTGKSAVVLDYIGLLALSKVPSDPATEPTPEVRVLIICPLVAVDTWVIQAKTWMSPQVSWWAEALGGSIQQRAGALASRGGKPYVAQGSGAARRRAAKGNRRATNHRKAWKWAASGPDGPLSVSAHEHGPDVLGNGPRAIIEILNLDTFASRRQIGSSSITQADRMLDAVRRYDPELVVVDESHLIKGASSNSSRLLARIGRTVPRRVILTGTVMPKDPMDVYAQWRFLQPNAFSYTDRHGTTHPASFGRFKERYAVLGGWMGKQPVGFQHLDEMQDIMAVNAEVALKKDSLDLPPITEIVLPVHLTNTERRVYRELKDDLAAELIDTTVTVPNRLAQLMRLRQVTSGHLPDADGRTHVVGDSKIQTIASLVSTTLLGEQRIVVFALFRHEIKALADLLARQAPTGTEVLTVTGDTSVSERRAMRERFGSDDPARLIMVAQIKTMSLAVNELVTASHAIFASLSQQRDDMIQARDRLHRIGQEALNVTLWYALAPGTVDMVIMQSHRDRSNLESAMLQHIAK